MAKKDANKMQKGFTIVELLIVIVVIAIISSITVVAYGGIQDRSLNAARLSEVTAWSKQFQLHKATHGHYPQVPSDEYCLGSGFPGGKCRDYQADGADPNAVAYNEADSASLHTALSSVGTLPSGPRKPVGGVVGPYINYWNSGYYLEQVFKSSSNQCPDGMRLSWFDASSDLLICYIQYMN
ncbi:prepilin-type N-terminal cleavage/methylation domain-containing protein [Candidatus Saccharibacteria bacterium]|nr:prepilin-type N-terminal cleavage/methylation domain-containing protein [Candidatus Saccharibacteria bacterium]